MVINNRNIKYYIILLLNIIVWWFVSDVDFSQGTESPGMAVTGCCAIVAMIIIDVLTFAMFAMDCRDDTIKFNYIIPNPFTSFIQSYKENRVHKIEHKRQNLAIEDKLIELRQLLIDANDDEEFEKIKFKLDSLESQKVNYG